MDSDLGMDLFLRCPDDGTALERVVLGVRHIKTELRAIFKCRKCKREFLLLISLMRSGNADAANKRRRQRAKAGAS